LNAYKNKLNSAEDANENCVVDLPLLHAWYDDAMENRETRDRIAVSGFNISRGVFGRVSATLAANAERPS
jgi:hypothetical protein